MVPVEMRGSSKHASPTISNNIYSPHCSEKNIRFFCVEIKARMVIGGSIIQTILREISYLINFCKTHLIYQHCL